MATAASNDGSGARPMSDTTTERQRLGWILAAGVLLRVVLASITGLSVDESYSTAVGRHFSLSYFDHPPLHQWMVGAATHLFGHESAWVARLPFIVLGVVSTVLFYRLVRRSYGVAAAQVAALGFTLSPFFSVGVASWVLPDGPLVCATVLMLLSFRRALNHDRILDWTVCGLAAGAGLLSKYLIVFPVFGCLLFVLLRDPARLKSWKPWWALAVAAACFTPVVLWNAQHQWGSLAYQGGRGTLEAWHPWQALGVFVGSLLYVGPAFGVLGLRRLRATDRSADEHVEDTFYACLALPAIAVFSVLAIGAHVLPHWSLIGWLFVLPLAARHLTRGGASRARHRGLWGGSAAFFALLLAWFVTDGQWGWWDRWIVGYPLKDPLTESLDWTALPEALTARGLLRPGTVIVAESYVDAGKIDYALGGRVPVLCLCTEPHHYGVLYPLADYRGREAVVVANARREDWWSRAVASLRDVERQAPVEILRNGRPAIQLQIATGRIN